MANLRTTVILKTDVVNSTPRTAAQTQFEMSLQRKQLKRVISETTVAHRGSIFQEEGDAYWIEYPSVTTAALAAMQMQQNLRSMQAGKQEKQRLAIRAVITVGDILYQETDTIGTTMSLTARIEKVTPPDEIYLSHAAWLVLNKAEVQTSYVTEFNFKGFHEPEKVYKIDQTHQTRVLTNQFIIITDVMKFTPFIKTASIHEVESLLLDCDDLINEICDKYGGITRQVNGDQYFLTFTEANKALQAVEELCQSWRTILEKYHLGITISVHKGDLNVLRSFVYGQDIHTTMYLERISKFYFPHKEEIHVIVSGKVRDVFTAQEWSTKFRELEVDDLDSELNKRTVREHGAFEFLWSDLSQKSLFYNVDMDFKKTVKEGYNAIADRYLFERTRDSEDVRLLAELIERLPFNAKVLDAGCGAGIPISQMLSEHFQVTGVDISETQIELAQRNVTQGEFICEDITRLKFPDHTFDGITSYYAIIHIPREEHQSLLANFHRMLKPGGLALLCLGADHLIDDIDENFFGTRMYWSHYDTETYLRMLKELGYSILWSKYVQDATCEGAGHLFVLAQK